MSPATPLAAHTGAYLPDTPPASPVDQFPGPEASRPRVRMPQRIKTGLKCPSCKSPNIRYSSTFTVIDGFLGMIGMRALRCHSCYTKFHRLFA